MKNVKRVGAIVGLFVAAMSTAAPSIAQQDIPWTWNSGDHDAKGKFVADGEVFHGVENKGSTYLDWSATGNGSGRWYIPGSASGADHSLNLALPEGKSVTMKVCAVNNNFPDDCSSTKTGVS